MLQTVPSLAMFVFMIPLFGIGAAPAIAALFLYSLLPIVRNTHAGLTGIAPELRESAAALGPAAAGAPAAHRVAAGDCARSWPASRPPPSSTSARRRWAR